VHAAYGGVVPELASRAHQRNIVPTVDLAIKQAGIALSDLDAIAYTRGPGLMGSLLVGSSFAKSMALALDIPSIGVDHMQGHILSPYIQEIDEADAPTPPLPYLAMTVSGGHTQLVMVHSTSDMEVIGTTIDDAAGEAFDKTAKMLGLPYPGGPLVDKYAALGQARFEFNKPRIDGLDMSFSGLKTSILYFLQREKKKDPDFLTKELHDICASVQACIVEILIDKLDKAIRLHNPAAISLAGGVAANSGLRKAFEAMAQEKGIPGFIPPFKYCTDNAAMIAMVGHFAHQEKRWSAMQDAPVSNMRF